MHVYLVQHGASKSEAEDPQRSLTDEGRGIVERTAEHLAGVGIPFSVADSRSDRAVKPKPKRHECDSSRHLLKTGIQGERPINCT